MKEPDALSWTIQSTPSFKSVVWAGQGQGPSQAGGRLGVGWGWAGGAGGPPGAGWGCDRSWWSRTGRADRERYDTRLVLTHGEPGPRPRPQSPGPPGAGARGSKQRPKRGPGQGCCEPGGGS